MLVVCRPGVKYYFLYLSQVQVLLEITKYKYKYFRNLSSTSTFHQVQVQVLFHKCVKMVSRHIILYIVPWSTSIYPLVLWPHYILAPEHVLIVSIVCISGLEV